MYEFLENDFYGTSNSEKIMVIYEECGHTQ